MVKKIYLLALLLGCILMTASAQRKSAYQLYTGKGKKVTYGKMLKKLQKADVILFGEFHNNPICHWLQWELAADLSAGGSLTIGAEMVETNDQKAINQYLAGELDEEGLDSVATSLWSNHATDYAPILKLAKERNLSFIASNVPRKYARLVFNEGFEGLDEVPDDEKQLMASLPIAFDPELPGYKNMLEMMADHGGEHIAKAQALKDATMAERILNNMASGVKFLHLNGTYHSENYEGILWYLQRARPDLKYATIATVTDSDLLLSDDNKKLADFILVVDNEMTPTY